MFYWLKMLFWLLIFYLRFWAYDAEIQLLVTLILWCYFGWMASNFDVVIFLDVFLEFNFNLNYVLWLYLRQNNSAIKFHDDDELRQRYPTKKPDGFILFVCISERHTLWHMVMCLSMLENSHRLGAPKLKSNFFQNR